MARFFIRMLFFILIVFLLPAGVSLAWWVSLERPRSWSSADWSSAGVLPPAAAVDGSVIHLMAARTGGLKGALSVHSWLVIKKSGESRYNRYDKVGWGQPLRVNAYAADGRWYSNRPAIVKTLNGAVAARLIPKIEAAIERYPHREHGHYGIWPGPNSNSFIAHILREVPEIGAVLPANAVGRDYLADGRFLHVSAKAGEVKLSLNGLIGLTAGWVSGVELNFLGLVAGVDLRRPAVKLPGFGRIGMAP